MRVGDRDEERGRHRDDQAADEGREIEQGARLPIRRGHEADAGTPSWSEEHGRGPEPAEDVERDRRGGDGEPVDGGEDLEHVRAVASAGWRVRGGDEG